MQPLGKLVAVKTVVEIVAHVAVLVTVVLGWLSYNAQVQQSKRNASFEVLSRLSSDELMQVQRRISTELARTDLGKFKGVAVPRETMAYFVESMASTSENRLAFDQDVFALVGYFDDVQICVSTGTCDPEVLDAHVGEAAGRYACLLLPYVRKVRENYLFEGLGDGMAKLANYESRC